MKPGDKVNHLFQEMTVIATNDERKEAWIQGNRHIKPIDHIIHYENFKKTTNEHGKTVYIELTEAERVKLSGRY